MMNASEILNFNETVFITFSWPQKRKVRKVTVLRNLNLKYSYEIQNIAHAV